MRTVEKGSLLDFLSMQEALFSEQLEATSLKVVAYPWRDMGTKKLKDVVPALVVELTDENQTYFVIYAKKGGTWKVFCGDALLNQSAKLTPEEREEVYSNYVNALKELKFYALPESWIGKGTPCPSFWREGTCSHVKHANAVLTGVFKTGGDLIEELEELEEKLTNANDTKGFAQSLKRFAFKVPVLIEGEQGSGKTYTAFQVAEELKKELGAEVIVGQGDNSVEATDLLGYWIKDQSGNLVWKDGVLTESFRKAQKGKVILLFDEFYRLRDREKDIFVRALTVFPDGKLRLRTGRVVKVEDGVAVEEIIEVPKENLWVIATTNVGAQFMVDEADPALKERFIILRKDTTEGELREILTKKVREKGYSEKVAQKLLEFYKKARKLFVVGELQSAPTTRTLVRAVELSESEEEVKDYLWEQRYLWIGRDSFGYPIQEQERLIKELFNKVFSKLF